MIKVLIRLNFFYENEDEIDHFVLMVKNGTSFDDVEDELLKAHKYLCEDNDTDLYRRFGRTPLTLIEYVCKKNGWKYYDLEYDIDLNFD
ncbi:MAG TPA: hypothetical protein DCW90_03630 [Lachnospiraceae bacterium]|nr:hypothetical protein [Lachnospiraceae bacterium]